MTKNEFLPKMIFYPGLGADERLFAPQRVSFPELFIPALIPPRKGEGLAEYAVRMVEHLPHDEPIVLGGVSQGGIIAFKVSRHIRPRVVILIASCHSREGLRLLYRAGGVLWPIMPKQIFRIAQVSAKIALQLFGHCSVAEQKLLVEMFREMDPAFMHWAVSAILRWNPPPLVDIPLFHIHGGRDHLIPAGRVKPDKLIPDGGHLINITHAEEVNEFVQTALQKVVTQRT
jgi:pimeloyl-ACP methyl ester carboxylesterase